MRDKSNDYAVVVPGVTLPELRDEAATMVSEEYWADTKADTRYPWTAEDEKHVDHWREVLAQVESASGAMEVTLPADVAEALMRMWDSDVGTLGIITGLDEATTPSERWEALLPVIGHVEFVNRLQIAMQSEEATA